MLFPAAYCFRYFMVFSPGMTGWQPHVRTRSVLFYQKNPRLSMKIHIQKENQRTGLSSGSVKCRMFAELPVVSAEPDSLQILFFVVSLDSLDHDCEYIVDRPSRSLSQRWAHLYNRYPHTAAAAIVLILPTCSFAGKVYRTM